jgi:hypothetical protein
MRRIPGRNTAERPLTWIASSKARSPPTPSRAAYEVRARDQSQDRQRDEARDSAIATWPGRSGDRVTSTIDLGPALQAFILEHEYCGELDGGVEGDREWTRLGGQATSI